MPYYRLYCIDAAGRFFHCDDFDADSDAEAVQKATDLRGEDAAELWQQGRLVHSFAAETIEQRG